MSPSGQRRRGVAVILKGYPRLSETFIAQELLGLERRGFRLHLISMRHPTDTKRHPIHDEIQAPVTYLPEYLHQEPLRVMRGLWAARRLPGFRAALGQFWRDLKRDVTRNRFRRFGQAAVLVTELPAGTEHLYAHFIHTPASVTHYAHLMTGLPWSCSAHAKDIWTSPAIDLEGKLISADWVATCTRIGAEHLTDLAGPAGDVHLIYHGLDLARFPSPPARTSTRDGSNADTPVRLLTVGRAVAKKGFDVLLDALARLPDETAWQLTHIGGGTELRALKAQADRLAIADRIDWQGARDQADVLAAYRASDLFVLPCRIADDGDRDGLPNVLVEAQSQALCCVSTPISAIPELITDGETGALVASEDAGALADALTRLIADPAARDRLGAAGEARVRAHFDMTAGLDKLAALFGAPAPKPTLTDAKPETVA